MMSTLSFTITFFLLLWTLMVHAQQSPGCTEYTGSICSKYVDYSVYTAGMDINMIEQQLGNLQTLNATLGQIDPTCVDNYFRYACSFYYPKCGVSTAEKQEVWMGCTTSCLEVNETCSNIFTLTGQTSLIPDCNAKSPITDSTLQPDQSCNYLNSTVSKDQAGLHLAAVPPGFVLAECPSPFIRDPKAKNGTTDTENAVFCRFGCCMPCPAQDLFFNQGWTKHGFLATNIVRFVSAVASFVILVSYLVLPDKRRHPSLLILNFALAIFLFSMVVFFSIGDPKRLQCSGDINPADMDNNALCGAQGAILIFSSLATVLWCAALIVNLHMHTVWNSSFFANKYIFLHVFCWGVPAAFMAAALGLHAVKFEFANLCLVSIDYIFDLFFYPMAAIIAPAFLLHILTFFYIAKVAMKESAQSEASQSRSANSFASRNQLATRKHKHVIQAVKIQWRALLLAIVALVTVLFYWIFYFTQVNRMASLETDDATILKWLECMLDPDNTQDSCTDLVSNHLPPFGLMITAETLVGLVGLWLFLIFGKRSIWREWNDWIYDMRVRGRMEKDGEQFFQL